jgi:hypothetical protein
MIGAFVIVGLVISVHSYRTSAVLNNSAKIDMHRGISVMKGKMSKIDICQHHGLELRNTAQDICSSKTKSS